MNTALLFAIPSPTNGVLQLGPLSVHAYGLCIAIGVLAAVRLASERWKARGGTDDDITAIALWGVPAGIIGARIYHVITDWELFSHNLVKVFYVWNGGLGIWGGIALGTTAGTWMARRRGLDVLSVMDAIAPAIPLAQAIGRLGNYFNQELFGRPTTLPWGLEISPANRPLGFENSLTFHPTFLYEALWNLALCAALIYLGKRYKPAAGRLFVMYVAGYTAARFFIEGLRIDPAHHIAGLRLNQWTSVALFAACTIFLAMDARRRKTNAVTLS